MKRVLPFAILGGAALISLIIVSIVRVSGASMQPNVHDGYYLMDKISYVLRRPARGEIVIFHSPVNDKFFGKRIIGLPNEKVITSGGEIVIYNNSYPQGFRLNESYLPCSWIGDPICRVYDLDNQDYLVLGDNRGVSFDSRAFGPIDGDDIVARLLTW